jgi:hypothetical protein
MITCYLLFPTRMQFSQILPDSYTSKLNAHPPWTETDEGGRLRRPMLDLSSTTIFEQY